MACGVRCSKGLKICCAVTAILLVIFIVVLVILFFTVFKPKDPDIVLQSVTLERFDIVPQLSAWLGIVVTVENPNYGGFTYHNSTTYVNYRGNLVAEAPILEDTIPARAHHNISTILHIFGDIVELKDLLADYLRGVINFTSTTTLEGKVRVLKLFKKKATCYSTCDLSVFVKDNTFNSTCNTQIEL